MKTFVGNRSQEREEQIRREKSEKKEGAAEKNTKEGREKKRDFQVVPIGMVEKRVDVRVKTRDWNKKFEIQKVEGSKVKEKGKENKCSEVVRKIENMLMKEEAKKEVKSKEKSEFERRQEMFGGAKGPMNCKRKISEN